MALEPTSRIEPCLLDVYPAALADVVSELIRASTLLGARLHPKTAASLSELVRVMNCYYSNLIEGHNTRPRDIERALSNDLDADDRRRDLQLEARAHIQVQRWIDERCSAGELPEPASTDLIRELHRRFYMDAPERMLRIEHESGDYLMVPGALRSEPKHDVAVGRHIPPSSSRVEEFMAYFERRYRFAQLGASERVVAMAAAHHRLNYIHPFVDGNGRVSRLMSHAMALKADIGAHGLWSISRGLARGLREPSEYKSMMDNADSPRHGDLDGRGNLSREALVEFVTWFCQVALDQVRFMSQLFELDTLGERLSSYVSRSLQLGEGASAIVVEVLRAGELQRGRAVAITGRSERSGREILSKLTDAGLLTSDSPKGPVRLHFDSMAADELFPRLFPVQSGATLG